ncbi:MAG: DNA (cytosine-5-)-methyltransferase [Candidatus Muirbacterium halophilum]|nr:DNA (cytosine-5-)-methyltransferase [Candidatus Muirbacterium halophilum]MCK9476035.1 DNA (cytosine-5-)-methyltransferase [Candidatus Muirbacterium halophilum]
MYKVADLFAGVGGVALAFKNAGFSISWANEFDKDACKTYKTNFSHTLLEQDIRSININQLPKIEVITAGFPCQPFSISGYRKGFEDKRGNLFFEILKFIDFFKPKCVFLENVKNLKTHDNGRTFKTIISELCNRNYFSKSMVLNTCDYSDIPQNRERIYIVAFCDKKLADNFSFPEKSNNLRNIESFFESNVEDKYYYYNSKYYEILKKEMNNKNTFYQWRRVYLRENKNGLCPTLTANMGTGGHNVPLILDEKDIRKLTPRECFRLQGFPDSFILPDISNSSLYKQAGNSVTIPVIKKIAYKILESLNYQKNSLNNETYNENTGF